jgi:transcriptional regulator with XRE-family HTH domain
MSANNRSGTLPARQCDFEDRTQFGLALTELRERAGLSVRDVAKALRIPPATAGDYFSGRSLPTTRTAAVLNDILGVCGVTDRRIVADWQRELAHLRRGSTRVSPSPYLGFAAYGELDAQWFHGRDRLVRRLTKIIEEKRWTGGVLALVGPSGAGKSSLLRAGVLPGLRSWRSVSVTLPGNPCRELSDQLCPALGISADEMDRAIHTDPSSAAGLVRRVVPNGLVIVVDQAEEVFSRHRDDPGRQAFARALDALAAQAVVVLGVRSDLRADTPWLEDALTRSRVDVPPMNDVELREAIERPAQAAGRELDGGLVEVLVRDMAPTGRPGLGAAHAAGALALLSDVLLATWRQRRRGRVTVADYLAAGGLRGRAVALAHRVVDSLSSHQVGVAQDVVRRVADDACRGDFSAGDTAMIDLLTSDRDVIAIGHHSLITAFPEIQLNENWTKTTDLSVRELTTPCGETRIS